jgi:transcriptional regulator with XRE-family HTH domain
MDVNQRCRPVNNRTPRARALGNALREARLDREIGLRQFAKDVGRDPSLLSRWETGDRVPSPVDVAQILGKLGVTGERYDEIIELASGADDPRWLATTLPEQRAQLAALLDFERTATVITDVSPLLIPGLLQTSDYARAIMVDGGLSAAEASTRVAIRMGRHEEFTRRASTRFVALVGEAALRQLIGTAEIMAAQLGFLLEMAKRPDVDLRVVPFDTGWHAGLAGAALLIDSDTQPPVIHVELPLSGLFLHARSDLLIYRKVVDTVTARAMSPEDSLAVVALAKAGWETT